VAIRIIALALVTLGITVSARAQWIVFDPTMNVQSIINTAQEIAKYVEVINNQVQQIQALTDQLNEFKHYESLFGDPRAVVLTTAQPLVNDLRRSEVGEALTALEGAVDAGDAMLSSANGLFTSIGTTFLHTQRCNRDATRNAVLKAILTELRLQNSQQTCPARSALFVVKKRNEERRMTNMKANDVTIETAPGVDDWRENVPADCVRNGPLPGLIAARFSGTRSYLRRLRAAEMAAWESSGGDYLLSECASQIYAR